MLPAAAWNYAGAPSKTPRRRLETGVATDGAGPRVAPRNLVPTRTFKELARNADATTRAL